MTRPVLLRRSHLLTSALFLSLLISLGSCGKSDKNPAAPENPPPGGTLTVHVSWSTGSDTTGDGSQSLPYKTLAKAYQFAGVKRIKMEAASYDEVPRFRPGIDVEGGYTVPGWALGASHTSFDLGAARGRADSIDVGTVISQVELKATIAPTQTNSIALYSKHSTDSLRFQNCRFIALNGSSGVNETHGADGTPGTPGVGGGQGSCDDSHGVGGAGGQSPGYLGGAGGRGGMQNGPYNGLAGTDGNGNGGGLGGIGGNGGDPGADGWSGGHGASGANGLPGLRGSPEGTVVNGEWGPVYSSNGTVGAFGDGGGGGGGGGAQDCTFCNGGGGNGGGGGGAGGGGASGGGGGLGGWGSLAVHLFDSSPRFENCYFQSGNGGSGGSGGNGGFGGAGGGFGLGGTTCLNEVGRGGDGGQGGFGGGGGGGAGGAGGPSYGLFKAGPLSNPTVSNPTFAIANAGTGGPGGANGWRSGGTAPSGIAGLAGNTN